MINNNDQNTSRKSGLKVSAEPPAMFMMTKWVVLDQDHQTGSFPKNIFIPTVFICVPINGASVQ